MIRSVIPGAVSLWSRAMPNDTRSFAIVVNTAPDEFLFIGSNGDPTFAVDSPGPSRVMISGRDEGHYKEGKWVAGRRLNGDEIYLPGLPGPKIGMLKVQLVRFDQPPAVQPRASGSPGRASRPATGGAAAPRGTGPTPARFGPDSSAPAGRGCSPIGG